MARPKGRPAGVYIRAAPASPCAGGCVGERLRRLRDPAPIPVRWGSAAQDLIDHWENVAGGGPVDLGGRFEEIADVLDRVPSGRLVVLGPAGTGKSVPMVRLALDRLERRAPGERIPVILPLATWRPGRSLVCFSSVSLAAAHLAFP
ncbi:hypothetical protein [Streptomyces mordarskii]|uniref:Uncharacterized protein n=1 Tax=Streptomyces mordarskii TaxID=1226758 RepID=A0ABP3N1M0_9ACTN|nr:hypothetical protein OG546_45500 [Streptomyces antimycoticus]